MLSLISGLRYCLWPSRRRRFGCPTSQPAKRRAGRRAAGTGALPGQASGCECSLLPAALPERCGFLVSYIDASNWPPRSLAPLRLSWQTLSKFDKCYCTLTPRRSPERKQLARRGTPAAVSLRSSPAGPRARAARQASSNARRRINKSQTPARCPATPSPRTSARAGPRSKYSVSRRTR